MRRSLFPLSLRRAATRACLAVLTVAAVGTAGCGHPRYINDLPLVWAGVKQSPVATTAVDKAFSAVPITFGDLNDVRPGDKAKVGTYEEDGFVVKTNGDVAAFWRDRFRALLEGAGARLETPPIARIDADLLEYDCIEGNTFNATVRMRVSVVRNGGEKWSRLYEGKGKRWGRTHNPENFNEALGAAMAEAMRRLVQDEAFANALLGRPNTEPTSTGTATIN